MTKREILLCIMVAIIGIERQEIPAAIDQLLDLSDNFNCENLLLLESDTIN